MDRRTTGVPSDAAPAPLQRATRHRRPALATIARALPPTQIKDSPETGPGLRPSPLVCASRDDLRELRAAVAQRAVAAGLPARRADDLVLAAHEVAANAHLHGGGSAELRTWTDAGEFLCEVADRGCGMSDPEAGTTPPAPSQIGGRGLWLARQLCDRVQIRTGADGTVVVLHLTL